MTAFVMRFTNSDALRIEAANGVVYNEAIMIASAF